MNLSKRLNLVDLLRLNSKYAIIQAPLAGLISTPDMVAKICNNNMVGSIGSGYLTPKQLQKLIRSIRMQTSNPINVNLMVPEHPKYDINQLNHMLTKLSPIYKELGVPLPVLPATQPTSYFDDLIEVAIQESISIVSFVFGIPRPDTIIRLKLRGTVLIGTATSVVEGVAVEKAGLDAVVAQGIEAGGHRGTFLANQEPMELFSLLPQMVDKLKIPVIAAGGITNGRGIVAASNLGAAGVQMGTVFLTTHESDASPTYKQALLNRDPMKVTKLTRAYSGKYARGIETTFMNDMENEDIPDYPLQNMLTTAMRKAANQAGKADYLSLWAGQSYSMCRSEPVDELISRLKSECKQLGLII